jgi:hypothetical protein
MLFAWYWHDDSDDRPDTPADDLGDDDDRPPPLRDCVRQRHAGRVVSLWGTPVRLAPPPSRRPSRSSAR